MPRLAALCRLGRVFPSSLAAPVPEPASFGLMALGLAGLAVLRRRAAPSGSRQ